MEATESRSGPKLCKENRYYYRHREEILARQKQKKMERDPEFAARCQAREQSKAEKEQKAAEKEQKRKQEEDLRRQKETQKQEKDRLKREKAEEKAKAIEQKRLLKATLLGVI